MPSSLPSLRVAEPCLGLFATTLHTHNGDAPRHGALSFLLLWASSAFAEKRVAIAIAYINKPALIIADEPTTALDVTIQAQILYEAQQLCRKTGTAMLWITHDLAVISALADRVAVMYAGRIVETGLCDDVIQRPMHPYTDGLLGSVPTRNQRGQRLTQIPGMTPSLLNLPPGCAFAGRCPRATPECATEQPVRQMMPGRLVRCCRPLVAEVMP